MGKSAAAQNAKPLRRAHMLSTPLDDPDKDYIIGQASGLKLTRIHPLVSNQSKRNFNVNAATSIFGT
jgi:hypothetical protein